MFSRKHKAQRRAEEFLRENLGLLFRVAGTYEADPGRREDLLQEISLAIWQASPRYESRSSFKTFALRIAHNRGLSHGARASRSPKMVDLSDQHPQRGPDPEKATEKTLLQESLLTAVRQLPLAQRQIVALSLDGLSYQEISEVLDISLSNVGARLNRARARLKEALDG